MGLVQIVKARVVDRSADEKLMAATSSNPDTKGNTAIRSDEQTLKQAGNDLNSSIPPKEDMSLNDENTLENFLHFTDSISAAVNGATKKVGYPGPKFSQNSSENNSTSPVDQSRSMPTITNSNSNYPINIIKTATKTIQSLGVKVPHLLIAANVALNGTSGKSGDSGNDSGYGTAEITKVLNEEGQEQQQGDMTNLYMDDTLKMESKQNKRLADFMDDNNPFGNISDDDRKSRKCHHHSCSSDSSCHPNSTSSSESSARNSSSDQSSLDSSYRSSSKSSSPAFDSTDENES